MRQALQALAAAEAQTPPPARSHKRHGTKRERDRSSVLEVMDAHGVKQRAVAKVTGIPLTTVHRALSKNAGRVSHRDVVTVRHWTWVLLIRSGWRGQQTDLWSDVDSQYEV